MACQNSSGWRNEGLERKGIKNDMLDDEAGNGEVLFSFPANYEQAL